MLMRHMILIVISLVLCSCARSIPNMPMAEIAHKNTVQTRAMPSFNQVRAEGVINVSLHTGYKHPQVILHGDPRDLVQVITRVQNNRLFIRLGQGYPHYGAVTAEVRGHYLNSFSYEGGGMITGPDIHSSLLDLSIKNGGRTTLGGSIVLRKVRVSGGGNVQISGVRSQYLQLAILGKTKVQLVGVLNLSNINLDGDGQLSMYWIKSPMLTVCGKGQSFIQLAGVVEKLDVELWGNAHFYGRYLRAKNAFVKTHNKAVADILAIKHQHTLATDSSNIYFFKIPQTKADFMAYEGSVLDMRDWNRDDLRDYDRYNSKSSKERLNLSRRPLMNMQ